MINFKYIAVLVLLIQISNVKSNCEPVKGAQLTFDQFNGKDWFVYSTTQYNRDRSCVTERFFTDPEGTEYAIHEDWQKTSNPVEYGTIVFDPASAEFTTTLDSRPDRNTTYAVVYFDGKSAGMYSCLKITGHKMAYISVSDYDAGSVANAEAALKKAGVTTRLSRMPQNDCSCF